MVAFSTPVDYERTGPILQRQRRITKAQSIEMAVHYEGGASTSADFPAGRLVPNSGARLAPCEITCGTVFVKI
jgi:hypothetical protein